MPSPHAELTDRGIAALRAGDRVAARNLLRAALQADPADARAWLWLAGALPEAEAQRYCLQRALKLDPSLEPARQGLVALDQALLHAAVTASLEAQAPAPQAPALDPLATQSGRAAGTSVSPLPGPKPFAPSDLSEPQQVGESFTKAPDQSDPQASVGPYVNPWLAIWLRPRLALRSAIAMRTPLETAALAALAGISAALTWAAWGSLGEELSAVGVVMLALVIGPPLGLAALLAGGVLLRTGGQLVGGQAGASRVRAALAWACLPIIIGLPLWLIQAALLPVASFGRLDLVPFSQAVLATILGAIHLGLWLWTLVLSILGLAEAHLMPWGRAVASWLVAILLVAGAFGMLFGGTAVVISLRGG
ncbi:MAG: YIP1 family protein [Oscillochloridaceae bacterium umkhey_bin13]